MGFTFDPDTFVKCRNVRQGVTKPNVLSTIRGTKRQNACNGKHKLRMQRPNKARMSRSLFKAMLVRFFGLELVAPGQAVDERVYFEALTQLWQAV